MWNAVTAAERLGGTEFQMCFCLGECAIFPIFPPTWANLLAIWVLANVLQPLANWVTASKVHTQQSKRLSNDVVHIQYLHNFWRPLFASECYFQNYWLKSIQKYWWMDLTLGLGEGNLILDLYREETSPRSSTSLDSTSPPNSKFSWLHSMERLLDVVSTMLW